MIQNFVNFFFPKIIGKFERIKKETKGFSLSGFIGRNFQKESVIRVITLAVIIIFCVADVLAQTAAGGFASATTTIKSYQSQVSNLMKAIGAVIAIVGAFNIFFKMQNGDQDVKKSIMLTIGGCIAFVALGEALPLFFE